MRLVRVVALLVLSLLGSGSFAALTCNGSSRDLGTMGPPDVDWLGNSFSTAGDYTDCYTFQVGSSAASAGIVWDFFDPRIEIESVSLYGSGGKYGSGTLLESVTDPFAFSFGALIGGTMYTYTLAVASEVAMASKYSPAGYVGLFQTYAAPVPEASAVAMLLLGLIGVGLAVRRKVR